MHAAAGNVERDRVGPCSRVRIEDRLAERPSAGVVGVGDREGPHYARPFRQGTGAAKNVGVDPARPEFEVPVAAGSSGARQVVAGSDIGGGDSREVLHERLTAGVLRHIAAVQQKVAARGERLSPERDGIRVDRQPRSVEMRAADVERAAGAVRDDVNGREVLFVREHAVDLNDAVLVGIEGHDVECASVAALSHQLVRQRRGVGHATVDEHDFADRLLRGRNRHPRARRHRRTGVHDTDLRVRREEIGSQQRRRIGRIENARLQLLDEELATRSRTLAHDAGSRVRYGQGSRVQSEGLATAAGAGFSPPSLVSSLSAAALTFVESAALARAPVLTAAGASSPRSALHRSPAGNARSGLGNSSCTRNVLLAASITLSTSVTRASTGCAFGSSGITFAVLPAWILPK